MNLPMPKTPPTLKDAFNGYAAEKITDCMLRVSNGRHYYFYDFTLRVMTTSVHHGGNSLPFALIDRDVLVEAREKLIELGGKPPELPPEKPVTPGSGGKFNL